MVSASVERDLRTNAPTVFVHLTDSSSRRFAQFTVANIEEFFDFRVNSRTVFKPIIREPITGGIILIPMQRQEDAEVRASGRRKGHAGGCPGPELRRPSRPLSLAPAID